MDSRIQETCDLCGDLAPRDGEYEVTYCACGNVACDRCVTERDGAYGCNECMAGGTA